MQRVFWFLVMGMGLVMGTAWAAHSGVQAGTEMDRVDVFQKAEQSLAVVLVGDGGGRVQSVSAGVVVRADGVLLTAYHPLKGAQEVQVRLRDGEVYDQVELIGFDERRDVAALHFAASGLACLPGAPLEEAQAGERVRLLAAEGAMVWSSSEGVLGPVRLADEVAGAGRGFRVIQFTAPAPQAAMGGALVNARGQLVGIITANASSGGQQFAVPWESVAGIATQGMRAALGSGKDLQPPVPNSSPAPEEATPATALAQARTLRVTSKTMYFTPFMLQKELLNIPAFRALDIRILEDFRGGDLLVNVDRPVFTWDFTYTLSDTHTGTVLATGKVTAIDGSHAAPGIARRLVLELEKARQEQAAQANRPEVTRAQ